MTVDSNRKMSASPPPTSPALSRKERPRDTVADVADGDMQTGSRLRLDPRYLTMSERQQQRNAKLLHLLSSSARVLARDGYAQFSIRAAAKEAGISASSLQHYFETKDLLIVETIRMILTGCMERYRELSARRDIPSAQALAEILDDGIGQLGKVEVRGFFLEMWALGQHDSGARDLLVQMYNEYRLVLADIVRGINPALSDHDVRAIAMLISAQTEGLIVMTHYCESDQALPENCADFIKLIWVMVSKLGPEGLNEQTESKFSGE